MLTATGGVALVVLLGVGPLAAVGSILIGIAVLAAFDLHAPPALAVGLLPFVIARPGYMFPVAVGCGTLLLTLSFLLWRWVAHEDGRRREISDPGRGSGGTLDPLMVRFNRAVRRFGPGDDKGG